VDLRTNGSLDGLSSAAVLCIYRIVQEALQNVVRHAKVGQATVELRRSDNILWLTVSDRGVGIEVDRASVPAGLGLASIRERTRLVNGTVDIQSQVNQGTTLTVRIPVP
jgi:signal transduction histidine kinase